MFRDFLNFTIALFLVLITLMVIGDYLTVMEVTQSLVKPLDFDAIIRICVYIEPTISTTVILMIHIKHTKKFLKSFETLNHSCNQLDEIKARLSPKLIRLFIQFSYTLATVGVIVWFFVGAFLDKLFEAFYKGMGFGIAFYIQGTIVAALFCHMTLTVSAFHALNTRLHQLRKTTELLIRKKQLRLIAIVHSDLCKAYHGIFRFCFPTVFLFFVRAGLQFCIVFMVFSGMIDKGDRIFLVLPLFWYGGGCFFTALVNDVLCALVSMKCIVAFLFI